MKTAIDPSLVLSFRHSLRSCTRCELREECREPVPWYGDLDPELAVLGEAPGKTEDRTGEPFVGKAGNHLRHWLKEAGWDPTRVTYLNSCACYPGNIRTPQDEHLRACRPWVNGQLEFIRPKTLLTVGRVALQQILGRKWPKIANLHGKPLYHPRFGFLIFPTYHPSAAIRPTGKKYREMLQADLRALREYDGRALEECYICSDELYRYDDFAIGLCHRHSQRQGVLWPEDQ